MLMTDDEELACKARLLRSHGMTALAHDRKNASQLYEVVELGYNYRIDDMRASLGLAQLIKLAQDIKRRNAIARLYREKLSHSEHVRIPFSEYEGKSSYYIFPVYLRTENRQEVMDRLLQKGIQTSYHYPPIHRFKIYKDFTCNLPVTEDVTNHSISLPMYSALRDEQVDYVSQSLLAVLKEQGSC